jgi:hypothetical protein
MGDTTAHPPLRVLPSISSTASPLELLIEVLLQLDIPSLTRFRCLNRHAMQLVNSVYRYTAIIKHCPNIIRVIVSIQADAFDCGTLHTERFVQVGVSRAIGLATVSISGLIDCRRVCYFCFIRLAEYHPLTSREASKFFTPITKPRRNAKSSRKLLELAKPPSILSLPGRYSYGWTSRGGRLQTRRLRLYDRRTVVQSLAGSVLPRSDKITREPKRYMAIISAPVLLNAGRQVDHGFFCLGCMNVSVESHKNPKHLRIKYTTEGMREHIASYGRVESMPRNPGRFMHVTKDQITP